ncbi:MAG: hypothetical protein ABIN94_21985 [Ferruginibacter sp.]
MDNIEKQIADQIAKANGLTVVKLGLRFDKVVVRLIGNLRTSLEQVVPTGETLIMTMIAPIKQPAKTEYGLTTLIRDFLESGIKKEDDNLNVLGNEVHLRTVRSTPNKRAGRFIGLVHNPGTNAKKLLDLAARWVLEG